MIPNATAVPATIKPLTAPNTVAKAIAEIIAKRKTPKDLASSGADIGTLFFSRGTFRFMKHLLLLY